MKKIVIPLIFLFGFFLFPINTYAESVTGSTTYYYTRCYYGTGNTICDPYDGSVNSYRSSLNTYDWLPTMDETNHIYYLLKAQDVQMNYNFENGKVYTITLNYDHGSYIKTSSGLYLFGRSNDINCSQGACSVSWENKDVEHTTATITFLPNNNYSSVIIGLGTLNTNNLGLFANLSTVGQGLRINNNTITKTSSSTDITPMVQQQQQTNNKIDETNNKIDETNDKLDALGDDLVDDTAPTTQDYNDFMGDLPVLSFGPISNALQLPIKVLNAMIVRVNKPCSAIDFGSLLGTELVLPCFSPLDYLDTMTTYGDLYSFIGAVFSIFIYYQCAMIVISHWEKWTSFDDGFNSLYQPKHADNGYKPKHGGGN